MSCKSSLRIGGPFGSETSISILEKELSGHFPSDEQSSTTNLQITNKYFGANVELVPFDHTYSTDSLHKEDGILLIFPCKTQIDTLTDLHNTLESTVPEVGDTLRLCISTHVPSDIDMTSKLYEETYSQRVLWCLDRGYEYIEVDITEVGLRAGFDDREKDGFARVVEAMNGTVWSSAVMGKSKASIAQTLLNNCDNEKQSVKEVKPKACEDKMPEIEKPVESPSSDCSENKIVSEKKDDNDNQEEDLFDNFEQMVNEAKRIREASHSGNLTDEERRARAGNAAEMLMGLLGQMGFEEEDDDSSCDSNANQ